MYIFKRKTGGGEWNCNPSRYYDVLQCYTGRKHLNMLGRIIIIRSDYECV